VFKVGYILARCPVFPDNFKPAVPLPRRRNAVSMGGVNGAIVALDVDALLQLSPLDIFQPKIPLPGPLQQLSIDIFRAIAHTKNRPKLTLEKLCPSFLVK